MTLKAKLFRGLLAGGLAAVLTAGAAFASIGTGTVTAGSSLRLRSQPNTSCSTLALVPYKAAVDVLENAGGGWYKVSYKDMTGYMSGEWLSITLDGAAEDDGSAPAPQSEVYESQTLAEPSEAAVSEAGYVNDGPLNVRSGPGTSYGKIGSLSAGAAVTVVEELDGWYRITSGGTSGYVSADYITLGDAPAASSLGAKAAALAQQQLGKRYVYGAAGPNSFDCSGLAYYVYRSLGVSMSRGSSGQYYNNGYFVTASLNSMQPGDLVFFFDRAYDSSGGRLPTTHMGIYVGNNRFIHASTTSYRVQYDDLFGSYYGNRLVGVKRIG